MYQDVNLLSGGNQQKVVLSKWLSIHPKVLIMNEPTRGVDVGAKAEIYGLIDELVKTQDLGIPPHFLRSSEVLGMTDRILIMNKGREVVTMRTQDLSMDSLLKYASGGRSNNDATKGEAQPLKKILGSSSFTPFVTLLLLFALFSILSRAFSMMWNIRLIVKQSAINGILGVALFLIVLTGGIDVSIGANLSLICTLTGMMGAANVPFLVIVLVDVLCGGIVGYLMGALVTKLHLPDLIVTLAAKNLIRGIALMLCQKSYTTFPEEMIYLDRIWWAMWFRPRSCAL